jgi:arylamine N-acetyltransferase
MAEHSTPLVNAYRKRFQLQDDYELPPTVETLQTITELHLQHIPFENLSLHIEADVPSIVMNKEDIMHKFFVKGRGGCCLELNGLFAMLLEDLGYSSIMMLPCWINAGKERGHRAKYSKFRTVASHFLLVVSIPDSDERYIVDVGFGEPPLGPLIYNEEWIGKEQVTAEGMKSRIVWDPKGAWVDGQGVTRICMLLEWWQGEYWEPRLQWDLPDAPLDKDEPPRVQRTLDSFDYVIPVLMDKKSSHRRKSIACKLTRDSKISLSGLRLKVTTPRFGPEQVVTITELESEEEVLLVLRERFGIELQEDEELVLTPADLVMASRLWNHL